MAEVRRDGETEFQTAAWTEPEAEAWWRTHREAVEERRKAEDAVRQSQQMLQLVMDYIPQFIYWKDIRSVYLGCNRNFARVAGIAARAMEALQSYRWPGNIRELENIIEYGFVVCHGSVIKQEHLPVELLAGHSGYDVVFPSLQPFAKRHIEAGVYAKLDKAALPNLVHVDQAILKEMAAADPGLSAPAAVWGTRACRGTGPPRPSHPVVCLPPPGRTRAGKCHCQQW